MSQFPSNHHDQLLHSLLFSNSIDTIPSIPSPLALFASSFARKCSLFSLLLTTFDHFTTTTSLCFQEFCLILQQFKCLLIDLSSQSRSLLLFQAETISTSFAVLENELITLLDVLVPSLDLNEDIQKRITLIRSNRIRSSASNSNEISLRRHVFKVINDLEIGIFPDRKQLENLVKGLGIVNAQQCHKEIETIEREVGDIEKWSSEMASVSALLKYAKCVLFFENSSFSASVNESAADVEVPRDFKCPISLELMNDPVVVSTGQTYDRESITKWIELGHFSCPNTGRPLETLELVPNRALKQLIRHWRNNNGVQLIAKGSYVNEACKSRAAIMVSRMTASSLVEKLAENSMAVYELRKFAENGNDKDLENISKAGAIPLLVPLLFSENSELQLNALIAIFILSKIDNNKDRILDETLDGLVDVLASNSSSLEAKELTTKIIATLASSHSRCSQIVNHPTLISELLNLLISNSPLSTKKQAMTAILNLTNDVENVSKLVQMGTVSIAVESLAVLELREVAVAVVAAVVKRGGAKAVWGAEGAVRSIAEVLRLGTQAARENAAKALVVVCREMGVEAAGELAVVPAIKEAIGEVMAFGTVKARRKVVALGQICRRWAVASASMNAW